MSRGVKQQNNYAFIDSQNLNLGTQKVGWKMNWGKFLHVLRERYGVTNAYLFIGYLPEYEAMYEQMHELGYMIVLKPTVGALDEPPKDAKRDAEGEADNSKQNPKFHDEKKDDNNDKNTDKKDDKRPEEDKKPAVKGNIDAELVMYAMKEMPNYDKAIIVSGDGDFYCLVEYLAAQHKLLHLMAPNWQYSSLLKPYEQYIVRLDKHRRTLAYHDRKKPRSAR